MTPAQLADELDELPAGELEELAHLLRRRAQQRRRLLAVDEAREAVEKAPLSPAWERSRLRHVGAVRTATRLLLEQHWRPEQIIDPLVVVCLEEMDDLEICEMAVAGGIADFKAAA